MSHPVTYQSEPTTRCWLVLVGFGVLLTPWELLIESFSQSSIATVGHPVGQ
jgi:Na+/citrate or Na+/malate symporter